MNSFDIRSLTPEKVAALRVLSDEIYPLLREAELAKFVINDLLDGYFGGDEPDGSPECAERLMCGYGRAQMQMQILLDYTHALKTALEKLEQIASASPTAPAGKKQSSCVISSKQLLHVMRLLSESDGLNGKDAEEEAVALFSDLPQDKQMLALQTIHKLVNSERDEAQEDQQ